MEFERLAIPDVILVTPRVFGDARGFFMETWEQRKFAAAGIDARFVQDNHSRSAKGTLRGLHYQVQQPQGKLVRAGSGTVLDIAVDLRRSSRTFGQWVSAVLSDENKSALWVPPGFAHGFFVLSETADFIYKCTDFYAPSFERTIRWDDAQLAIDWQRAAGITPLLSAKDAAGAAFSDAETFP